MIPPLMAFPLCETARLRILPLTMGDAPAVASLTDDPVITDAVHFLRSPFTAADAATLIGTSDADNCFLGLWQGGDLIGVAGAHAHGGDRLEIGYWIGSRFQRRGYAAEAVATIIARLRQLYPARTIVAECRRANEASWALLEKLGFRPTGEPGARPGRDVLAIP